MELVSLIGKLKNGLRKRGVILVECKDFGIFLKEILGDRFEIHCSQKIEEMHRVLKNNQIDFIFRECNFKCSKYCKEIFSFSRENFIPIGILRPFTFNHNKSSSFSFAIYSPLPLSPIQEMIRDYIKESKYCISSESWRFENRVALNIAFIQRSIIEDEIKEINLRNVSQRFNLSAQYLSNTFVKLTGIKFREFFYKKKMCDSLYYLVDEKPIKYVAFKVGFKDRSSFSKAFSKNFNFLPSKTRW